jgi:AraC family transcriptional regulator, transcriptional activator FtrA
MSKIVPFTTTGPLVVALAYDGLCTFEYAIAAEIFGLRRPELGPGWYRFATCAIDRGPLRAHGGLRFETEHDSRLLREADLIVIPGWKGPEAQVPAVYVRLLRAAHARGARLASLCSGAFVLAAAGLVDGRRIATHWRYAEALRKARPQAIVDADVLYVAETNVMTSAGSAAGVDLLLHIVRMDFGPRAANSVARRLVMPPHRDGGQAQFIERPVPVTDKNQFAALLDEIRENIGKFWTIDQMAREAAMSKRTFARQFVAALGIPPGEWLLILRIDEAKRLLEETALSVEQVAGQVGFGVAATLRHHFGRLVGLTPRDYRRRFGRPR